MFAPVLGFAWLASGCDLLAPTSTIDALMETASGVARVHVSSQSGITSGEDGRVGEQSVSLRGEPSVQVVRAEAGADFANPEIGDVTFDAWTKTTPVWAGSYTPSSASLGVAGLGVATGLVLVAEDASWTGIDNNWATVRGRFDGAYDGATLSETRFQLFVTNGAGHFRLSGEGDDGGISGEIGVFIEDTCPAAARDHVFGGSAAFDADAKTMTYGDGPTIPCGQTGEPDDNGTRILMCGTNIEGFQTDDCTWKLVVITDPKASQLVIAGFGRCGGEEQTCNSWW